MIFWCYKNLLCFRQPYGLTPLHYAAQYGHLEVCQLLMKNLIDKNPAIHEIGNFNSKEKMAPYFFTWTPIESTKGRESNTGVMTVRPVS